MGESLNMCCVLDDYLIFTANPCNISGKANAERMLGPEGWTPTAAEAKEAGFVNEVIRRDL